MLKEHLSFGKFILNEKFINLFSGEFNEYIDIIWDMLQKSYENVPSGFLAANSKEELINKSAMWKMARRNNKIVAAILYKDRMGRKSFAVCSDGTKEGKRDLIGMFKDDIKFGRSWTEVSGKPEKIYKSHGATPIPAEFAAELTGKSIEKIDSDGFHYWRIIHGVLKQKIMYGTFDRNAKLIKL